MLQLDNHTPFLAELTLLNNEDGVDTLYVVVKATFCAGDSWTLSDEPVPIWKGDEYRDEPGTSSVRYPGEYHLGKMATDILVEGNAQALNANAVTRMPVEIQVGERRYPLTVFGDRVWYQGQASFPEPFVSMPLQYERAFGGNRQSGDRPGLYDQRNPVGRFVLSRDPEAELDGEPMPNVEHPHELIRAVGDNPAPAGVGPVAPDWLPRAEYAGTFDQHWQTDRAPFAPEDFSRRFFNVAPPGLVYPGWLGGGEPFRVEGMHFDGPWQGELPVVNLSVIGRSRGRSQRLRPRLETVFLQPNQRQLSMTWRAELCCDKRVLNVDSVSVATTRS